ncbi:hypothetical protein BJ742DRAFT_788584 [Cladochytrium replicatum]|nr:hypothetical protein BJ742DRAFT_788584 [Cladochytrium replicatum]
MSNQDHPPSYDAAVASPLTSSADPIQVQRVALAKSTRLSQSDDDDREEVSSESTPLLPPRSEPSSSAYSLSTPVPPHNDSIVWVPPGAAQATPTVTQGQASRGILEASSRAVVVLREMPEKRKRASIVICMVIFVLIMMVIGKYSNKDFNACLPLDTTKVTPTVYSFDPMLYQLGTDLIIEKPNRADKSLFTMGSAVILESTNATIFSVEVHINSTIEGFEMVPDVSNFGVYTLRLEYNPPSGVSRSQRACVAIRTVVKIPAYIAPPTLPNSPSFLRIRNENGYVKVAKEVGLQKILLPKEVRITNSNGPIEFGEARVEQLYLTSSNGPVRAFGVKGAIESSSSPKIEIKTSNAPVTLTRVSEMSKIFVRNSNAKVVAEDFDVTTSLWQTSLQITTDNGAIVASRIRGYVALALTTSNDKILLHDVVATSELLWRGKRSVAMMTSNAICGVEETYGFDTVKIQTSNGAVKVVGASADDLSIKTDTESVNLQNLTIGSALTVTANSGSVKAGSSDKPIQFDSSIGKVKRTVEVKVSDGSIKFYAPYSYTGSFDINTSNDEYAEVSPVSKDMTLLVSSRSKKVGFKGNSSSVQAGQITLHTTSGGVNLIFA